ncbi:MAG TPA: hypothetical protein VMT18_06655 [Planctomycetota bacterium]|nr:hypothetical protein [Planctomycetota bacterium]
MKPTDSKPEQPQATPQPPAEAPKAAEDGQKDAAKYVFKIVPANPKNAFDFEDVADK